jgi:hypothetical protein
MLFVRRAVIFKLMGSCEYQPSIEMDGFRGEKSKVKRQY